MVQFSHFCDYALLLVGLQILVKALQNEYKFTIWKFIEQGKDCSDFKNCERNFLYVQSINKFKQNNTNIIQNQWFSLLFI